jgi:hypothetical protein
VTDEQAAQRLRLWVSSHENGWEAWVAEHADGTFTAWACPAAGNAVATYIEDSFENACAAAHFDLGRLSRHRKCGTGCGSWEPRPAPGPFSSEPS